MIETRVVELSMPCSDHISLWNDFLSLLSKLTICVVGSDSHEFPGGGFTGLVLLSESHAAIHTWPEKQYVWCELATCGDVADCEKFEDLLRQLEKRAKEID